MATTSKYGFLMFANVVSFRKSNVHLGIRLPQAHLFNAMYGFSPAIIHFFFNACVCCWQEIWPRDSAARLINTTSDQSQTFEAQAWISFFNLQRYRFHDQGDFCPDPAWSEQPLQWTWSKNEEVVGNGSPSQPLHTQTFIGNERSEVSRRFVCQ